MHQVSLLNSYDEEDELIESYLRSQEISNSSGLQILEAGCGTNWPHKLDGVPHVLTGVDLDEAALAIRKNNKNDLHIAIHGDLHTVELPKEKYDVIFNSFVLEHVDGAEGLLSRFLSWLKPGGILIIRFPDRNSAYGVLTRMFPFFMHVWYRRLVEGDPNAGKPGHDPYPTFHDRVVSRKGFLEFIDKNNLKLIEERGHGHYLQAGGVKHQMARYAAELFSVLSLRTFTARYNNLLYIVQKPLN